MKVLLVNKYWYPRGGAEVVAMMTKELLDAAGHETAVFSMQHPQNQIHHDFFPPEIDYHNDSLTKKIKNSLKSIHNNDAKQLFEKMIQEFQPDVVHFHNIYHQLSFSLLEVTKKYKIRTVMTLHDYKLLSPNYSLYHHGKIDTSILGRKYYRCLFKNCMESIPETVLGTLEAYYRHFKKYHDMIDVYISPSDFLKQLFVNAGWKKNRIEVVRNPVLLPKLQKEQHDGDSVTYIGRLLNEKGIEILLQAAKLTPEIPYSIVGTGQDIHHLRAIAIHQKLKNVTFHGWKTGADLQHLYSKARILVVPSVWYENYPLGILEAKSHAKIVIASDIGGIPEMLDEKFLFSVGDVSALVACIQKWYTIPQEQREITGRMLREEVATENDPKLYVKKLLQLYQGAKK